MLYRIPVNVGVLDLAAFRPPPEPTLTGFARLETSPCSPQFDIGLSAPLADPLWLLARQWQFNERQGEDAGTPIALDLDVFSAAIDRFAPGAKAPLAQAQGLSADMAPVEVLVEAEAAMAAHPRLDAEAGLNALKRARASGLPALLAQLQSAALAAELPPPEDPGSDAAGLHWHLLLHQRVPSAGKLAAALAPGRGADGRLQSLPVAWALPAAEEVAALEVLNAWLQWLDGLVVEGQVTNPSWQPQRQEYAFSMFASGRSGDVALRADEYSNGQVDWDSFVAEHAGPPDAAAAPAEPLLQVRNALPVPVRYPGMPADRYWEFEDTRVHFAGLEASPSSLVRLVLTEFALAYGNDWFMLPIDVPLGHLVDLQNVQMRDNFGVPTVIPPSDHRFGRGVGAPWRMFELSTRGAAPPELADTLALPDTLAGRLEGPPLEEVLLVRDEMANMAWGIERKVQGSSGEPIERRLEAERLAWRQRLPGAQNEAALIYRLATPVPAHWIPLLPRHDGNPLQPIVKLVRGGMARFYSVAPAMLADADYAAFLELLRAQNTFIQQGDVENGVESFVLHPRGRLLKEDPALEDADALQNDSLEIAEEEVPRAGAVLQRRFQYARSADGRAWLWVGRSKTSGSGEAASGLAFDTVRKRQLPG